MRSLIRSRRVALPLAALAVAGTTFAAYGVVADEGTPYRTVAAAVDDVDQVLGLTGVVESSGRSDLAFGTAGTVAKVPVAQGDAVEEGDVIAVLDRTALRAAVDRATSDLADAKAQLAADRDAQTSAVSAVTTSATGASAGSTRDTGSEPIPSDPSPSNPSASNPAQEGEVLAGLAAQQEAVIAAQSASSAALATAEAALTEQAEVCTVTAIPVEPVEPDAEDASTEPTEPTETAPTSEISEECTAALAAVQSAQSAAATAQGALQAALESLGNTLTVVLGTVATEDQPGAEEGPEADAGAAPAGDAGVGSAPGADSNGTAPGADSGPTRTVTAATLAADQAAIDRAGAELASARVSLRAAVVRAPADGAVASLSVTPGADVAGGDVVAVLVAPGLTTVALEVTATQATQLAVDTTVDVTPTGATDALTGSIGRVENVPTAATTGSDPTYAVEVVLDERDLSLPDGIPAAVAVVVGSAADVVVVPASAVVDGVVTVLDAGQAERVPVTTGIVGSTVIEIIEGVDAGEEVVLADLGAELPSGDTQDLGPTGVRFGNGGGFPAGGPPSGGIPGR